MAQTDGPNQQESAWGEQAKLVLYLLEEHSELLKEYARVIQANGQEQAVLKAQIVAQDLLLTKHTAALEEVRRETAVLNVKAGVWGALGGLIPALVAMLYLFLKH